MIQVREIDRKQQIYSVLTLFIYGIALLFIVLPVWLYAGSMFLILIYVLNKQISVLLTEVLNVFQFCIQKSEFIIAQLLTKELLPKEIIYNIL